MTKPQVWTHAEYSAAEITMGQYTPKPRVMVRIWFPRTNDGYKTRACSILERFKPYYSHRLGYVVSRAKFVKFQAAVVVSLWRSI